LPRQPNVEIKSEFLFQKKDCEDVKILNKPIDVDEQMETVESKQEFKAINENTVAQDEQITEDQLRKKMSQQEEIKLIKKFKNEEKSASPHSHSQS
jgi:hypothetical protein